MCYENIALILGSIATIILVFIALFHDVLKEYINMPKLRSEIEFSPPHCHRVITDGKYYRYYFAFKIWNKGKMKAENIEVTLTDLFKKVGNKWIRISGFNQDNLIWRLTGKPYLPFLNPKIYKQCNIGYIIDPKVRPSIPSENNPNLNIKPNETIFHIQVSMQSTNLTYLIAPGIYKFKISVSCSNGKTINKNYRINITGKWFENEDRMLNEGINISEI